MSKIKAAYLFSFVLLISLFACKAKNTNAEDAAGTKTKEAPAVAAMVNLVGSYVGSFGDNKITVLITKATKDSVEGRSVVGGNDRPFTGTITVDSNSVNVEAKEPGNDAHDGTFYFYIYNKTPDVLSGSWEPYNPAEKGNTKEYKLDRKAFVYSPDAGTYPASKRLLKEADVNNLTKQELEKMRNEIFARHGYCFKKKALRADFEYQDWYVPNTADVKNILTDIERKNISLIKKYEKYAEDYGDEFGR